MELIAANGAHIKEGVRGKQPEAHDFAMNISCNRTASLFLAHASSRCDWMSSAPALKALVALLEVFGDQSGVPTGLERFNSTFHFGDVLEFGFQSHKTRLA